jgi:hypothetical protein
MPVNPAQSSNDRPVTQYSTEPVSDDIHPVTADATSAANVVPPADQFQVLRGGTTVPSAGPAGSPPPGNGAGAKDVGLADIVGAVVNFLFKGPTPASSSKPAPAPQPPADPDVERIRKQLEDQQHELAMKAIRDIT